MKRIFLVFYLSTVVTMLFGQLHQNHDHNHEDMYHQECMEARTLQLKAYAAEHNWESQFYGKYDVSIAEFTELNSVHTASIKRRVLSSLCNETLAMENVLSFVFEFIDTRKDDLLFSRPVDLLPGQISFGKYYKRPINDQTTKTTRGFDEPCNNVDFETGDITNWEVYCGEVNNTAFDVVNITPYTPGSGGCPGTASEPSLIVSGGNDPEVGAAIPMVNPVGGGLYSLRLGDGTGTDGYAALIRQTFLVDPSSVGFSYSYAIVLDNGGGHAVNEQPFFRVRVFDESNNEIDCGAYSAAAGDGQPGWASDGDITYLPWTTVFTNLSAYVGQNVTIEFATGDCSQSGHWGYAYIDASCGGLELTSSAGAICDGDPVTLNAPPGADSYSWNNGEVTPSIIVTTPGTYTVSVIPEQGAACAVDLSIDIEESVSPIADFTASPTEVCVFEEIEFTDASDPGPGETMDTWQWNFGNGESTAASSGPITSENFTTGSYDGPVHAFQGDGNYTVTLTVVNSTGCSNSTTLDVIINPLPAISAGLDIDECEDVPIVLSGSGGVSYTWDNDVVDGEEFLPSVGSTVYTVTGIDANGCENTDDVTVTIIEAPIIEAGEDQAVCDGDGVTLSASGGSDYVWSNNVEDNVEFIPTETTTYYVTYTNPLGCVGIDSVIVVVNDLPNIGANSPTACEGSSVTLNGTGGVSYTWNNLVQNGVPFVPVSGTTYTVTGEDANGCVNTFDVTVTTSTYPTASFSATPTSGQPPLEVTITNNSQGDITDYSWDFGNGNTSDQDFDQITEVYNEAGNPIIVLIVSNNGCNDTLTTMLDIQFAPFSYDIPNVFTPNNDGANDYFDLKLENAAELEFYIFNRWGNLMAEIRDVNTIGWDGRTPGGAEAPDGVYFHRYRIVGLDGQVAEGHGFLHLVRD